MTEEWEEEGRGNRITEVAAAAWLFLLHLSFPPSWVMNYVAGHEKFFFLPPFFCSLPKGKDKSLKGRKMQTRSLSALEVWERWLADWLYNLTVAVLPGYFCLKACICLSSLWVRLENNKKKSEWGKIPREGNQPTNHVWEGEKDSSLTLGWIHARSIYLRGLYICKGSCLSLFLLMWQQDKAGLKRFPLSFPSIEEL